MANKNDATLETTKQMLDELDALMERMLSLPVSEGEEASTFPKEVVKTPPPLSAKLTMLTTPPAVNPPHRLPPASPPPSLLTKSTPIENPLSSVKYEAPAIEAPPMPVPELPRVAAPPPEPLTNDVLPPSTMPKLESLMTETLDTDSDAISEYGYQPLLWLNQTFDSATEMLGDGGAWLRSQIGRMLLGLCGLGLTVIAAGWLLKDLLGWHW